MFVHVTLVPWIAAAQELKTKPTQHSVKELRAIGIQPDILLCRSERPIPQDMKEKIALFCDVDVQAVITAKDVDSVYEVPLTFAEQGVDEIAMRLLALDAGPRDLTAWTDMVHRIKQPSREVSIGLVGKYVEYEDSYKSLKEALLHGGLGARRQGQHHLDRSRAAQVARGRGELEAFDGILVPGGFGRRGIEGMLQAIRYARESKVPYFGICLGMQTMVIEFARNVCGLRASQLHRVRSGHARSRDLQAARAEGRRRAGRHHAPGRVSLPARGQQFRAPGVRAARDQRASSPPLRIQSRVRSDLERARPAADRRDSRRRLRRDLRAAPIIPGSWAASSIPSSNRSRWSRILCSARLWAPRSTIGAPRRKRSPTSVRMLHPGGLR